VSRPAFGAPGMGWPSSNDLLDAYISCCLGRRPSGVYLSTATGNSLESLARISKSSLLRQGRQHVRSDRPLALIGRDLLVRAMPDPRVRDVALTALLEALNQLFEAATEQPAYAGSAQVAEQSV
jgi:hypothetical protein